MTKNSCYRFWAPGFIRRHTLGLGHHGRNGFWTLRPRSINEAMSPLRATAAGVSAKCFSRHIIAVTRGGGGRSQRVRFFAKYVACNNVAHILSLLHHVVG